MNSSRELVFSVYFVYVQTMNIVNFIYDQLYMFVESIHVLSTYVRMDQPFESDDSALMSLL